MVSQSIGLEEVTKTLDPKDNDLKTEKALGITKARKNSRKYLRHGPTKIRLKDQQYAESLQDIITHNY